MGGEPRTEHPDAASSSPIARSCLLRGRDENSCWCRSGHSPLTVATELVVSSKTTTLITVLLRLPRPTHCTFTSRRKVGDSPSSRLWKRKQTAHPLEIEVCERNVLSGSRVRSTLKHLQSEASVLIDLTTTAAKKLVVELPATVKLGFCSAPIHDVSFDSVFTTLELCALKPWLVRPAKESNCTVIVCGSHVKRVLTSDGGIGSLLRTIPGVSYDLLFMRWS